MAIVKIEPAKQGNQPFFDDWKKDINLETIEFLVGKLIQPKQIKHVSSGKGFMLNCADTFSIFVWGNSAIGKYLKKAIKDECCDALFIQFEKDKKGLSYSFCLDDEIEVILEEDRFEESLFYQTTSTGTYPPIAPNDYRSCLSEFPEPTARTPVIFKEAKKPTDKNK